MRSGATVQLTCDHCGKVFLRLAREHRHHMKTGSRLVFCSSQCVGKHKRRSRCKCGVAIEQRDWRGVGFCRKCWLEEKKIWRTCIECGTKGMANPDKRRPFVCAGCKKRQRETERKKRLTVSVFPLEGLCKRPGCGIPFIRRRCRQEYCSPKCRAAMAETHSHHKQSICKDCGVPLEGNVTHASYNHPVCDHCMYLRRRKYKGKAIIT